ncbi:tobamovirus multiplication 2B isoform X2 [Wolffia australiana]
MASATGGIGKDSGSAKAAAVVEEHIIQAVKSTSNLIHLMQDESPSQVQIEKLTKNLLQKTATVKNTGQIISSLDAYMEGGLQSGLRLDTTEQMLSNMESSRIRFAFKDQ